MVTNTSLGEGLDAPDGFSLRYVLMARCLAELGHQVRVISFGKNRPSMVPADALAGNPAIDYHAVDSLGGSLTKSDRARRLLRGAALRLGSTAYARPWEREVSNAIAGFKPSAVMVAAPFRQATCALVPTGVPLIYFAEEDLSAVSRAHHASPAAGERSRRIDLVVTISEAERRWADQRYGGVPVLVVPHVVDLGYWGDEGVPLASDPPTVLCAGDFAHERNAGGLRDVLQCLGRTGAGERPVRVGVASARRFDLGPVHSGVELVDLGPVDDLRPYYRAATVVLVPSFVVSGVKTQILQAWATGVAAVTTSAAAASVGGHDGDDLIAGDSPDAVARGVMRALSDPALRASLIDRARTSVRERFSTEHMTKALDQLLDQVRAADPTR